MKFNFKIQPFRTEAVESIVRFAGAAICRPFGYKIGIFHFDCNMI